MKHLIIDTSYLIYRSHFAYPRLTSNGVATGAFFGFAKTVIALIKEYKPDTLIFALDTPKPTWRHKLKDDYKAGRPEADKDMVAQIPVVQDWCKLVTKNYFVQDGYEADDFICTACYQIIQSCILASEHKNPQDDGLFGGGDISTGKPKIFEPMTHQQLAKLDINMKDQIYIFSSDRDLFQLLVYPNVYFIQNKSSKDGFNLFGHVEFREKYELEPIQWIDYKSLVGDGSDNLQGLPGVGPKTATNLLSQVGSLHVLLGQMEIDNTRYVLGSWAHQKYETATKKYTENPKNSKLLDKIRDNVELLHQTHHLSQLEIVPGGVDIENKFDLHKGTQLFQEYGFKSLVTMTTNTVGFDRGETDALF
jgi:DNA polymerase I